MNPEDPRSEEQAANPTVFTLQEELLRTKDTLAASQLLILQMSERLNLIEHERISEEQKKKEEELEDEVEVRVWEIISNRGPQLTGPEGDGNGGNGEAKFMKNGIGATDLKVIKFDGENYSQWKPLVQRQLEKIGAMRIVTGQWKKPEVDPNSFRKADLTQPIPEDWFRLGRWTDLNREAEMIILGSVTKDYVDVL
jgi:hypothetical protein